MNQSLRGKLRGALANLAKYLSEVQEQTWSAQSGTRVVLRVTLEQLQLIRFAVESLPKLPPVSRLATLPELSREEAAVLETEQWQRFRMAPGIRCRVCGCSDDNVTGCILRTGEPCHWVQPGLCSACATIEDDPEAQSA